MTTGCNTVTENLETLVEKHYGKLTETIPTKINDSYHLIDIFETLNAKDIPDNVIFVSFKTVHMFPSINNRGVAVVKSALDSRTNLSPSKEHIIEALEICLTNNNSDNSTTDNAVTDTQRTIFREVFYFGWYRDNCITLWTGDAEKIDLLLE